MKKKIIAVAVPSRGTVSMWWTRAVLNIAWPLNMGRKFLFVQDDGSEPQIAEARNSLVAQALVLETETAEVEAIMWIDDDVLVNPGCVLALYNHHAAIASGVYFTKCDLPEPLIFPGRVAGTMKFPADKILKGVWGHGMGLTLVKLSVYKALTERGFVTTKDRHGNPEWYKTTQDYKVEEGMLDCGGTEDLYFCQLCREAGIASLVDCTRHAFGWHYDLAAQQGFPRPQFEKYRKAQPIEWDTDDGTVTWA